MAIKGLRSFYFAKLLSDLATGTTYAVPKPLPDAMTANLQPNFATGTLYGDDALKDTESQLTGIGLTIGATDIRTADEAELLGKTVDARGGIADNADDNPPYVAFGWKAQLSADQGGGFEYTWILKTKFAPSQQNYQGKDNNVTFQTPTLAGQSVTRKSDGLWRYKVRDTDPGVDPELIAHWFDAVQDGVGHAAVTGVSVDPSAATIGVNAKFQLSAVVTPADAGNKKINYTTSDPAIATVDSVGIVTGVAAGTATITATTAEGNFTDTCAVTVA